MSETATTSQADSSTQSTAQDAATTDQASATTATEIKDLPQWAQDHIKSLRTEAASHRTKAQQLEDQGKTELQRITDERDRLKADLDSRETRLRGMAVTAALTDAFSKAGARYPTLMVKDVADHAELDDELNVKNTDKLIKAAKEQYPDQFRVVEGTADGGQGRQDSGNGGATDMNRLLRQRAGFAG